MRAEEITDSVVEMFDVLVGRVFSRSDDDLAEARLEHADAQAEGARLFREAAEVVLDSTIPADAVRAEVFRRVPLERLSELVRQGLADERSKAEQLLEILRERFPYVRSFAGTVLDTLTFEPAPAGAELARALEVLRAMGAEGRRKVPADAPREFVPARWQKAVEGPAGVDRRAWELCLLGEIRGALRAGELTVVGRAAGTRRGTPGSTRGRPGGSGESRGSPNAVCLRTVRRSSLPPKTTCTPSARRSPGDCPTTRTPGSMEAGWP